MTFVNKQLFRTAVLNGDSDTVRELLTSGVSPNIKCDGNGTTPLHLVSSPEIAEYLIKCGADIEAKDSYGRTPLCCAVAYSDRLAVVKILLSAGAKVNVRIKIGQTPLHIVTTVETTNVLLSCGAEVNSIDKFGRAPIHSALIDGKGFDVFMALLKAGANVNIRMGRFENSLLHYADSVDVTRQLLLRGANVNAVKIDGQTPLHCAVRHMKQAAVVRELLKWGAKVDIPDHEGETALGLAMRCYKKNFEAIRELLRYGANINVQMFDCSLVRYCYVIESALFSDLPCAELLVKMFILMNWKEGSPLEIRFDRQIHHYNTTKLLKYKNDCVSEVMHMKYDKIFVNCTFYELVTKKKACVKPIYESFRAIEKSILSKYPIYHDVIMEEIKNCLDRGRLLTRLEQVYNSLKCKDIEQIFKLNSDCLLMIAKYLSDSDILNIIISFEEYYFQPEI